MKKLFFVMLFSLASFSMSAEVDNSMEQDYCTLWAASAISAEFEHDDGDMTQDEYVEGFFYYYALCSISQIDGSEILDPVFV